MHGDGPDGIQFDENGNYIEFFKWDGEDMTEEEYEACLNAVYPADRSMRPQKYYILDEICSILRTGNVSSAEHKYEFVVEDVTWEEARQLCQEKGGYLATITSQEELERLQEQMISEDKINVTFFVGANDTQEDGSFIGYRWLEPGTEEGYRMLELSNALFGFWQEGEPSYRGWTESGEKVDEGYVVLFYQESDRRCYLRDVPNDVLDAAPSRAGRVGYICEFGHLLGI